MIYRRAFETLMTISIFCFPLVATAHFPWLIRDSDDRARLFFGEGPNDRTYKLPPTVAQAEIQLLDEMGQSKKLATIPEDTSSFVGLVSTAPVGSNSILASSITYGLFRGARLHYTALAYGLLTDKWESVTLPRELMLQAKLIETSSGVSVRVTWDGQPLSHVEVSLLDADGEPSAELTTNESGITSFSKQQLRKGLNAIRVGHKVAREGKLGDEAYSSEMYYLTATFVGLAWASSATNSTREFAALPFAITSFGAATDGQALYVYGGHMGDAHSYSFEEQSDKLLRLKLHGQANAWEELSTGTRVQGTAMIAYGSELIVVGGFQAKNAQGKPKDLHSLADVRSFNTQTKTWSDLPVLPEPRSSHDAALIGSTVYVVGGWQMSGDESAHWHKTAWKMDLSKSDRQWEPIAEPPFQRRALATIEHAGKLIVVGGMNPSSGPTKAVHVYDPLTLAWSSLPEIQGENSMAGFGASGWSINGKLVITSQAGAIQTIVDGSDWQVIGQAKDARFFHRILPVGGNKLVAIGGANMNIGKFREIEVISIEE